MAFFKSSERMGEGDQPEQGGDDDDGIDAGSLPVTSAEVQPHTEFIEGKPHGDAVEDGGGFGGAADRATEYAITSYYGHHEYAVIQMVDMVAADEEIKIGHCMGHDEEDENAGHDEGDQETKQGIARQFVGGFARDMMVVHRK